MEKYNNLYDYVLWLNTYESKWYAIKREYYTDFFANESTRSKIPIGGYLVEYDLDSLIDSIFSK